MSFDIKQINAMQKQIQKLNLPSADNPIHNMNRSMNDRQESMQRMAEEVGARNREKHEAILDTAEALRLLNAKMEEESLARVAAKEQAKNERKTDRILTGFSITIGLLTLIATVLLGILALMN